MATFYFIMNYNYLFNDICSFFIQGNLNMYIKISVACIFLSGISDDISAIVLILHSINLFHFQNHQSRSGMRNSQKCNIIVKTCRFFIQINENLHSLESSRMLDASAMHISEILTISVHISTSRYLQSFTDSYHQKHHLAVSRLQ